jgi:hypothetical protein
MPTIIWSDYMQYRARLREFDLNKIEEILRYSGERYYDTETDRIIVVGKHDSRLVVIPYESRSDFITPITIHVTTRQQIRFRLNSGRYIVYE